MSSRFDKILVDYAPYIDDLWKRVYRTAIFFVIIFVLGFFGSGYIIEFIINLLKSTNAVLVTTSPFQFLDLAVDMGLFLAFLFSVPILILHFYSFLRPAVSKYEFRSLLKILPLSFFLFIGGFAYGFFALYLGLQALAEINISHGLKNYWDVSIFFSQVITTSMLLGLLFQFPIIMSILIRLNIFSRNFLVNKRRISYVIITIAVALLPPTDGLSMLIMVVPFILMYESVILLN